MGPYYAEAGPDDGILLTAMSADSIEVFEDPDRSIPIGTVRCIGWDAAGSAVWRLVVHDDEAEGPWLIVDREFLSTRPDWRDLYRHDDGRPGGSLGPGDPGRVGRGGLGPKSNVAFLTPTGSPAAWRFLVRRPIFGSSIRRTQDRRPGTRGSPAVGLGLL